MKMLFSPSTLTFYCESLPGSRPDDCIPLESATYAALMEGQATGRVIGMRDGQPALIDPPTPPAEQLAYAARRRRQARLEDAIALLERHRNQVDFGIPATLSVDQIAAVAVYAQALRDIPAQMGFPAEIAWPQPPADIGL